MDHETKKTKEYTNQTHGALESGKRSRFPVGECGDLRGRSWTSGKMGKIGHFIAFPSHFSPTPEGGPAFSHPDRLMIPQFPPFLPIPAMSPHVSPFPPPFPTPKSWFCHLVGSVAVSADA